MKIKKEYWFFFCTIVMIILLFIVVYFNYSANTLSEKMGFWFTFWGTGLTICGLVFSIVQGYQAIKIATALKMQQEQIKKEVTSKLLQIISSDLNSKCHKFIEILNNKKCDNNRCCDFLQDIIKILIDCKRYIKNDEIVKYLDNFKKELTGDMLQFQKSIPQTKYETINTLNKLLDYINGSLNSTII